MMKLRITSYPNNELRATFYHECGNKAESADSEDVDGLADDPDGNPYPVPLDITSELTGTTEKPGYGGLPRPTRFGNNARRTLSRAAGVFDKDEIPRTECLFLTGTIPGSTAQSFEAVARWSSWIVNDIKRWMCDQGALGTYSLYVWELQSRGALHIHYCAHVPDETARTKILWKWTTKWAKLITEVGNRFGCDTWEKRDGSSWKDRKGVLQAPAQFVKKSVGNYLAKYVSKNAPKGDGESKEIATHHGPVRWWGVSRPLLKRLNELTESFEIEGLTEGGVRRTAERVKDAMSKSSGRIHHYWDKGFNALTLLTYCPEECESIYQELWRELYGPTLERLTRIRSIATRHSVQREIRGTAESLPRMGDASILEQRGRMLVESLGLHVYRPSNSTEERTRRAEERSIPSKKKRETRISGQPHNNSLQLQLVAI